MRVRRAVTVSGAVAALVLLGGPAWADETPSPAATSDTLDPAGNPDCFLVPDATDTPVAEPTDAATDEPTADPTDPATTDPTDAPTSDVTDGPTADATDGATADPTDAPTAEPTDTTTASAPGSHEVCLAYTDGVPDTTGGPTLGSGTAQLPFSGAPVGRYAATGLALVLAGAGTVVLAGRRRA